MTPGYSNKIQEQIKANKEEKELQVQERSKARRIHQLNESQPKNQYLSVRARPASAPARRRSAVVRSSSKSNPLYRTVSTEDSITVVKSSKKSNPQYRTVKMGDELANPRAWMSLQHG